MLLVLAAALIPRVKTSDAISDLGVGQSFRGFQNNTTLLGNPSKIFRFAVLLHCAVLCIVIRAKNGIFEINMLNGRSTHGSRDPDISEY